MNRIQTIVTPTGLLAVILPTAQRLLAEGVISGTLDGQLHAADAATVKAALMHLSVCDFCSTPGATHHYDVPDFNMRDIPGNANALRETGGWMACDTCAELIDADKRDKLTQRAIDVMAFPKFSRRMLDEFLAKFWHGMDVKASGAKLAVALYHFINDTMPEPYAPPPELDSRMKRLLAVAATTGLTRAQVEGLEQKVIDHEVLHKLMTWHKKLGNASTRQLLDMLAPGAHKPLPNLVPHWQRALDQKFNAMASLSKLLYGGAQNQLKSMGFEHDLRYLRTAQVYSFNEETTAAITEAAKGVPHDAPLSSIETPNAGAGWFWFDKPLDVTASYQISEVTNALLWAWANDGEKSSIVFSVYVWDEKDQRMYPSTRWYWPVNQSFHNMMAYNTLKWDESYGEQGKFGPERDLTGKELTLKCVADLSLFFIMSCLWFKQTVPILTREPGHVERHARKRMVREHQLTEAPSVQIVALRRSERVPVDPNAEHVEGTRSYQHRWVVMGHPRLQACGPGRKDRKLIWVEAFVKGPDDKPLMTRQKVYAVIR